ncbi:MAG: prolyl oligopeptidase family serine peptidase [Clostridia bacterium]|nr:prolyl oligopeptidase family serine peptidase [Clostridia bacterium]
MDKTHSHYTEYTVLLNTKPSYEFDKSRESFSEWKKKSREKLYELLGMAKYKNNGLHFKTEQTERNENFTKIRFTFESEPDAVVPCYLLIPENSKTQKPPVMICLQGHGTGMHISLGTPKYDIDEPKINNGDRDFACQCMEKGICALVIEQRCFGERGGNPRPDCHSAALTALLTGRTLIGGRVWDIMKAIDVLQNEFYNVCDTEKIYCMGNSGGGTATLYAFALEDRIKAAIPSCAFCTFADSIGELNHCVCNYIPHIAEYFDMAEIAGMAAPKPLVIVSGIEDGIFPIGGAKAEYERAKKIYAAAKAENKIAHVLGEQGHRFYADKAWKEFFNITE